MRILLVEDHVDTARMMARLLKSQGYTVVTAGTVAEAIEICHDQTFDLLVSDVGLPDGTGYDFLRELRKGCEVPAIALTGYDMEDDIARSRDAGFDAHMTKPISLAQLQTTIRQVVEAKRPTGE